MKTFPLTPFQASARAAIRLAAIQRGWKGEFAAVEGMLVYQVPLPMDPDVAGVFFAVDAVERNVLLYYLLPLSMPKAAMGEACEFTARQSSGMRFGALELDLENGTLRVRVDCDLADDAFGPALERLIERGRRMAQGVSTAWRALCRDAHAAQSIVEDALTRQGKGGD